MDHIAQNLATYEEHFDLFQEANRHNQAVTIRRMRGGDWSAPENQYRNAWREVSAPLVGEG
jgi:hypothetical protein